MTDSPTVLCYFDDFGSDAVCDSDGALGWVMRENEDISDRAALSALAYDTGVYEDSPFDVFSVLHERRGKAHDFRNLRER